MRVKIDDTIHDSNDEPIMLILSMDEKKHISEMGTAKKYCSYPDNMSAEQAAKFMNEND